MGLTVREKNGTVWHILAFIRTVLVVARRGMGAVPPCALGALPAAFTHLLR